MKTTKQITITLTPKQQEKARIIAKRVIGKNNISGLFAFWINDFKNYRKAVYSEEECMKMVFNYAQFVIDCMDDKCDSLPVGVWFDKNKKLI